MISLDDSDSGVRGQVLNLLRNVAGYEDVFDAERRPRIT